MVLLRLECHLPARCVLLTARCGLHCPYAAAAREEVEGRGPLLQLLEWLPPPGTLAWPPAMALALALAGKWPWELECDASLRLIRDEEGVLVVQEATLRAAGAVLAVCGERRVCVAGARLRATTPASAACPACGCLLMSAALLGRAESPCSTRLASLHRYCSTPPPDDAGIRKAVRKLRQAFRLVAWLHSALGAALPRLEARIVVPPTKLRAAQRKLRGTSRTVQEPVPGEAGAKFTVSFKAYTVY